MARKCSSSHVVKDCGLTRWWVWGKLDKSKRNFNLGGRRGELVGVQRGENGGVRLWGGKVTLHITKERKARSRDGGTNWVPRVFYGEVGGK